MTTVEQPEQISNVISGTIFNRTIEDNVKIFYVRVQRAPSYNVLFKNDRWELWKVLALTSEGAIKIAQYHFHRSDKFEIVTPATILTYA